MDQADVILYCPDLFCQAPNPRKHRRCQKCDIVLPKHYLWATHPAVADFLPGTLLAKRYLLVSDRILLDTRPGQFPHLPNDLSADILPYLHLTGWRLYLPQAFGTLPLLVGEETIDVLLLEHIPVYPDDLPPDTQVWGMPATGGHLMPRLVDVWKQGSALRQLTWLWQMAQLWQPFAKETITNALFNPELIRVEGTLIRFLELPLDTTTLTPEQPPLGLADLGQFWLQQLQPFHPAIAHFLHHLCQSLIQGTVQEAELLLAWLDEALRHYDTLLRSQTGNRTPLRQIQIATATDQGPSRQQNEDACYPLPAVSQPQDRAHRPGQQAESLVIVCDGLGGHEGGKVASHLAVDSLQGQIHQLYGNKTTLSPPQWIAEFQQISRNANGIISERNDAEQRHERQRMGTTLVMGVGEGHELYLTHVGDSRAYWITRTGCHQVTLDDDIASRETRLGYSFYREALQQISAGALIQALGMGSSMNLYPNVQRFPIAEDVVFLFCSDGLSDNDRVDECWMDEILPVLSGQRDLATACQSLVNYANQANGHDNVTIGLMYYRITDRPNAAIDPKQFLARLKTPPVPFTPEARTTLAAMADSDTDILAERPNSRKTLLFLLLGLVLSLGLGGGLAYWWFIVERQGEPQGVTVPPEGDNVPSISPTASLGTVAPSPVLPSTLDVGKMVELIGLRDPSLSAPTHLALLPEPGIVVPGLDLLLSAPPTGPRVPFQGILKVKGRSQIPGQETVWLQFQVCSEVPASSTASPNPTLRPVTGWLPLPIVQELILVAVAGSRLDPQRVGTCALTSEPSPEASALP